jgi:hypothetical protein
MVMADNHDRLVIPLPSTSALPLPPPSPSLTPPTAPFVELHQEMIVYHNELTIGVFSFTVTVTATTTATKEGQQQNTRRRRPRLDKCSLIMIETK